MKRILTSALMALTCVISFAQKKDIVKTGLNLGPLPVVAYDADKGLQLGAILNVFDYGNGDRYPNYDSKWYFEASFFTKGSQLFQIMYDNKVLIPGVRWSSAISLANDKAMDFFGFNGYESYYNYQAVADGKAGKSFIFTPFYKMKRLQLLCKTDFIGNITEHFHWEAGYHASYFNIGAIDYDNINKGKKDTQKFPKKGEPGYIGTLYEHYVDAGVIGANEANGGFTSSIRLGLEYDSRNKEGAPSSGIWAETHVTLAPKWLGSKNEFYRYSATWRHYVPIVKNDVLTFAYRLNYEGTFGKNAPFYVLPYITVMGENCDKDGMGGFRNVRGVMRDRVAGLDMATYTAEFRWRFVKFIIGKQNIALALSAFSDGSMVTKDKDISALAPGISTLSGDYKYREKDTPHITFGAGFRFIMNENFIVAAEYGTPLSHFYKKTNPLYNQDGPGAFYVNVGYLF